METLKRFAGTAGVLIALAGIGIVRFLPDQRLWGWTLAVLGAVLVVAGAGLNAGELRNVLRGRPFRYGAVAVFYSLVVLVIVLLVTWLAARHNQRFDMTPQGAFSLSPQTRKILKGLDQDVSIVAFFTESWAEREKAADLLDEYKDVSSHLTVRIINPNRSPAEARAYEVEYDGTVIISGRNGKERVTPFQAGLTEQDLTNAIIKATSGEKRTVCLSTGHGETSLDESEPGGWQQAAEALRKENFEVASTRLLEPGALDRCSAVVVAGPSHALLPPEVDAVKSYLDNGGRLLVMLEPRTASGLEGLLASYGLKVHPDFVVELNPMSRLLGGSPAMPVIFDYGTHAITRDLQGIQTIFPTVSSIETGSATEPDVTTEVLARTTDQAWGETGDMAQPVGFDEGAEQRGPLAVAAAATRTLEPAPAADPGTDPNAASSDGDAAAPGRQARVALFGDSEFSTNRAFGFGGNRDLLLNTIAWLGERADLISVRPKSNPGQPLILTALQGRVAWFYSLLLFPALLASVGFGVYLRRRRL